MLDVLLGNEGLAALIAFALVLIPAVIVHELGHFIAGKSVGITILEFGIGFPPRIGRMFTWRGTEFTLNWLPLGGFVRPLGEDIVRQKGDEEENLDRQEAEERGIDNVKAVNDAKPLQRIWFLSAGAIANLISAFLLFVLIGALGVPGISLEVADLPQESPLYAAGVRSQDVIESLDGTYFLRPTDFFEALESYPADKSAELIVRRGENGEMVLVSYNPEAAQPSSTISETMVRIMGVVEGAPAGKAGIEPGDLVVSFNGTVVTTVPQLIELTFDHLGKNVTLELQRAGETFETTLIPRTNPPEGEGAMGIQINTAFRDPVTGIIYQPLQDQVIVGLSVTESVQYSAERFTGIFQAIAGLPSQIMQGRISAAEARPVSVVGISQIGGRFLRESIEENQPVVILNYVAIISIALGLTNLLPLPALDGGRILFVLIEMVRGRPIPPEREGVVHLLGLIFLLSVTVVVIINDIINPIVIP
jgi:regulator of sigma E protease